MRELLLKKSIKKYYHNQGENQEMEAFWQD
jgi:hypothetical protein